MRAALVRTLSIARSLARGGVSHRVHRGMPDAAPVPWLCPSNRLPAAGRRPAEACPGAGPRQLPPRAHEGLGRWAESSPTRMAAVAATEHAVELPLTFADGPGEGGAGTTRIVSAEALRFVARRAPGVGRRIEGAIRFLPAPGGVGAVLRYAARVTAVAPSGEASGLLEVRARFERLAFGAPGAV